MFFLHLTHSPWGAAGGSHRGAKVGKLEEIVAVVQDAQTVDFRLLEQSLVDFFVQV